MKAKVMLGDNVTTVNLEDVMGSLLEGIPAATYSLIQTPPKRNLMVEVSVKSEDDARRVYDRAIEKWQIMKKFSVVLVVLFLSVSIVGCETSSPFERSIQNVDSKYKNTPESDKEFVELLDKSIRRTNRFTDEERIKYAKAICTLLDGSHLDDREKLVKDFEGEEQALSNAAIAVYCPEHL